MSNPPHQMMSHPHWMTHPHHHRGYSHCQQQRQCLLLLLGCVGGGLCWVVVCGCVAAAACCYCERLMTACGAWGLHGVNER